MESAIGVRLRSEAILELILKGSSSKKLKPNGSYIRTIRGSRIGSSTASFAYPRKGHVAPLSNSGKARPINKCHFT